MNTQLATRQFRIKQWSEIIHARIESGQTIKEWCKQNNVSEKSYYYWLNKLKTVAVEEADSSFFEVPAMQASSRTDHDNTFSPELNFSSQHQSSSSSSEHEAQISCIDQYESASS